MSNFKILPHFSDSCGFLYLDACRLDVKGNTLHIYKEKQEANIPCANISCLFLGPGTSITHSAARVLGESGCSVVWCGEDNLRFYASGIGETNKTKNLYQQVKLWSNDNDKLSVARRMYEMRFKEQVKKDTDINQLRGMEGSRIRNLYAEWSKKTGVIWNGRQYHTKGVVDLINKSLSIANTYLYGVCHSCIVALGFSPALGFIHSGFQLSFVCDVADLYKEDLTIPISFKIVSKTTTDINRKIREECQIQFNKYKLTDKLVKDIYSILLVKD